MNGVITENPTYDFGLEISYFILICLSCYSIYVIFEFFVFGSNNGAADSAALEQTAIIISVFYILILVSSVYLLIVLVRGNHFAADSNHIILFVFNCFLFFYGFVSLFPSGFAAEDSITESVYAPVATSALSVAISLFVIIKYTSRGSSVFRS